MAELQNASELTTLEQLGQTVDSVIEGGRSIIENYSQRRIDNLQQALDNNPDCFTASGITTDSNTIASDLIENITLSQYNSIIRCHHVTQDRTTAEQRRQAACAEPGEDEVLAGAETVGGEMETIFAKITDSAASLVEHSFIQFIANAQPFVSFVFVLYFIGIGWALWQQRTTFLDIVGSLIIVIATYAAYLALASYHEVLLAFFRNAPGQLAAYLMPADDNLTPNARNGISISHGFQFALLIFESNHGSGIVAAMKRIAYSFIVLLIALWIAWKIITIVLVNEIKIILLVAVAPVFLIFSIHPKTVSMTQGWFQSLATSMMALFLFQIVCLILFKAALFGSGVCLEQDVDFLATVMLLLSCVLLLDEINPLAQAICGGVGSGESRLTPSQRTTSNVSKAWKRMTGPPTKVTKD